MPFHRANHVCTPGRSTCCSARCSNAGGTDCQAALHSPLSFGRPRDVSSLTTFGGPLSTLHLVVFLCFPHWTGPHGILRRVSEFNFCCWDPLPAAGAATTASPLHLPEPQLQRRFPVPPEGPFPMVTTQGSIIFLCKPSNKLNICIQ